MKFTFGSILKFAGALAIGVLILAQAPLAQAAFSPTMLLCVSDFAVASNCVSGTGGGGDFVMLESDGVTVQTTGFGGTFDIVNESTAFGNSISASICLGSVSPTCIGGLLITTDTGTRSLTGSPSSDLTYNVTAPGAATANVWWSTSGFTGGAPFTGVIGGSNGAGSTTSWVSCIENQTNTDPISLNVCGAAGTSTINSGSTSAVSVVQTASSGALNTVTPFGIEQQVKVVTTAGTTTTGDFAVNPAPEPSSILLFSGAALLAFGAIRRKMQLS